MAAEQRLRSRLVGNVHNRLLAEGRTVDEQTLVRAVDEELAELTDVRAKRELNAS